MGERLAEAFGQQVVIDNRGVASTIIGAGIQRACKSESEQTDIVRRGIRTVSAPRGPDLLGGGHVSLTFSGVTSIPPHAISARN